MVNHPSIHPSIHPLKKDRKKQILHKSETYIATKDRTSEASSVRACSAQTIKL